MSTARLDATSGAHVEWRRMPKALVASSADGRPLGVSLVLATVFLAVCVWLSPASVENADRFPLDDHASASLDQALNLAFCRRTGVLSTLFRPARHLKAHPEDLIVPADALIAAHAGSVGRYCASLDEEFMNNENGLMLMMASFWAVRPAWSVDRMGRGLLGLRVLAVGLFGLACLEAGASAALAFVAVLGSIVVLGEVNRYQYTVYPFLLVVPLAWLAVCSLGVRSFGRGSLVRMAFGSVGFGTVAAFCANLRTSYWPLLIAGFLVMTAASTRIGQRQRRDRRAFAAIAVGGFVAGAVLFQLAVIRPIQRSTAGRSVNYTYHTVAHPLVMALAVPPNDLSRRESIFWDDTSGFDVARRVKPDVTFLGPDYERALYQYYTTLWREHPRQMLSTYWLKLRSACRGVFLQASQLVPPWGPLRRVYLVWADRVNGLELLLSALACAAVGVYRFIVAQSRVALVVAFVGLTTALLVTEAAIIYSTFFLAYHSFVMLMVLLAPVAALQAVIDTLAAYRVNAPSPA